MLEISGVIEEIIYKNDENGYVVCELESISDGLFTAVGYMPSINEGDNLLVRGEWILHQSYGEQFKVSSYETVLPKDEEAIFRYLATGIVKGVREATAKKIVKAFGKEALDIMSKRPEKLSEIKGISLKGAIAIGEEFAKLQAVQGIVMFLQQYGISANLALKVHKIFGHSAVEKIKENPYALVDRVDGISFKTADNIAFVLGRAKNSVERIRAGIKYMLIESAYTSGHTYLPKSVLIEMLSYNLEISEEEAENGINSLILTHDLVIMDIAGVEVCYLIQFSAFEDYIAKRLVAFSNYEQKIGMNDDEIKKEISKIAESENITLAPEQENAIITAIKSSCVVITGGPGTGKTTTINTIIKMFKNMNLSVSLAAPTGRAAKRMSEVTGLEAKTIHRLLGVIAEEENHFTHNETNPLKADVIILDEVSMIDVNLMYSVLLAVKLGARLILSGDSDQLPSVGPGNILRDIIESEKIPIIRLERIFRQASESLIVVNAHKINKGEIPIIDVKDKDFFFLRRENPQNIKNTIVELYTKRLPKSYGIDPISSIQILSPSKKGLVGANQLNRDLQYAINPPDTFKAEHTYGEKIFRVGDKVMQIKNNYDIPWIKKNGEKGTGIFNGDMGIISSISVRDKYMTVIFDEDKEVEYLFCYLDELELSYAITVHKSQGNEFPIVVIPAFNFAPALMCKNLLYTAVTRAKKMVVIVGSEENIVKMINTNNANIRYSGLCYRIKKLSFEK